MATTHKGVIVLRRADKLIPDAYLDLVYKKFTTGQGIAFAPGDGMVDSFQSPIDPISDFKKTMNEFKDTTIGYYFYEDTEGYRVSDVPPFSLIREDQKDLTSKTLLSVLLHGDFIGFDQEPVAHSNA